MRQANAAAARRQRAASHRRPGLFPPAVPPGADLSESYSSLPIILRGLTTDLGRLLIPPVSNARGAPHTAKARAALRTVIHQLDALNPAATAVAQSPSNANLIKFAAALRVLDATTRSQGLPSCGIAP